MNSVAEKTPFSFGIGGSAILSTQKEIEDDLFINTGRASEKAVAFLNNVFIKAIELRVADIHFQYTNQTNRVRFRMPGGALADYSEIPLDWISIIDDKIRSRAHLNTTDRRSAQDGRMNFRINGINIDVRVALTPGVSDGQLIVCRLLNQSNSNKKLDDIEMPFAAREAFLKLIDEPNGLFLITGPTGSGKTTTLYAMLNELNDETRNIITVENPVEYRIQQFHQINVDGNSMTFAGALRSVLRQDPDVVMVGEIRDHETASIAVQAAITGHLVLSTMHANSAPMAITRLIELGIDPMTLSAALRGVTAQRLVRTISNTANVARVEPNEADKYWLRNNNIHRTNPTYPKVADQINDYKGVIPVMEIVIADQRVKKSFSNGESAIYEAASRQPQFETLAQASERLAFAGRTTLDEARRTSSSQEAPTITNKRLGQVLVESGKVDSGDMEALLTLQAKFRASGNPQRLGKMLIEGSHCTSDDLLDAVGFTAEAQDILMRLCINENRKIELANLVRQWTPGVESLFTLAVDSGLVTMEELKNESTH